MPASKDTVGSFGRMVILGLGLSRALCLSVKEAMAPARVAEDLKGQAEAALMWLCSGVSHDPVQGPGTRW